MFLRHTKRKKDGKKHRYWSIVENRRVGGGRVAQRPLLYLGEINDAGAGLAQIDCRPGGRGGRAAHAGAVSRGSLRRDIAGRVDRPVEAERTAADAAAPVGWLLAGTELVARIGARRVLAPAAASESQGDALGPGSVGAGGLPTVGAGQRVASAPRMVRAQRDGRSIGRAVRAGRNPQALPLPRPAARTQDGAVRSPRWALARLVQRQLRRAALRSDQHLFRGRSAIPG